MNHFTFLHKPTKSYTVILNEIFTSHSIILNEIFISSLCSPNYIVKLNRCHLNCHNIPLSIWPNIFKNLRLLYFDPTVCSLELFPLVIHLSQYSI